MGEANLRTVDAGSDIELVREVRDTLKHVIKKMEAASKRGITITWNVGKNDAGRIDLLAFRAVRDVELD